MGNKDQGSNGLTTSNKYLCNFFDSDGDGGSNGERPVTPAVEDLCDNDQGLEGSPTTVVPQEYVAPEVPIVKEVVEGDKDADGGGARNITANASRHVDRQS